MSTTNCVPSSISGLVTEGTDFLLTEAICIAYATTQQLSREGNLDYLIVDYSKTKESAFSLFIKHFPVAVKNDKQSAYLRNAFIGRLNGSNIEELYKLIETHSFFSDDSGWENNPKFFLENFIQPLHEMID